MVRSRVFVSSVVEEFGEERETARRAIEAGGCEPVLVNEDFPSLAASSRNACLDAIGSCDALALIVGFRGGWVTPSGRLVVEEEYHHARSLGLPVVVLLADTERDGEATRFVRELSDYVDGHFRTTYRDMPELAQQLERAVGTLTQTLELPMVDMTKVLSIAAEEPAISDECSLRVVVVPERDEELIDPAKLQSSEFLDALYGIGHDRGVGLLDYERPKTSAIEGNSAVVVQSDERRRTDSVNEAIPKAGESGCVVVETNVTGWINRDQDGYGALDSHVVAYEDIVARLEQGFQFVAALMEELDPYKRHVRFVYQVAVMGIGYRNLERDPKPRNSFTLRNAFQEDRPILIPGEPRAISRNVLSSPSEEICRVMALLERHLAE